MLFSNSQQLFYNLLFQNEPWQLLEKYQLIVSFSHQKLFKQYHLILIDNLLMLDVSLIINKPLINSSLPFEYQDT